jgi:PiT family inorganic phosphate transporter
VLTFVVIIVAIALLFDFLNGMNDAANSIATIVSTRVLSPRMAVAWAAFFNFAAAFTFGVHVATTIGKGIVDPAIVTPTVILGALVGAVAWTHVCTQFGLPISVSHALIGGLAGAGFAKAGAVALVVPGLVRVAIFIVVSPLVGMVVGAGLMLAVNWIFRRSSPHRVDRLFRVGQLLSSAAFSLGHGTNDAQKTMGIIAVLLFSTGYLGPEFYVPWWVIIAAYLAIAAGTLAGGWKVIHTMGVRLTDLRPVGGFCAESAGAVTLIFTALAGIPVSTTHTIAAAIMGVGSTRRLSAVRWGVAGSIVWAWILTIPLSALVSGVAYLLLSRFLGS